MRKMVGIFKTVRMYDLLFSVKVDTWQGREKLDLILEDAKIKD